MTIRMIALRGVALLAIAQAAEAAPPTVSGKYALLTFTQCNAKLASAVASLNSRGDGELSIGVGTVTFPATANSAGNASLELSIVGADVLRLNGSGSPVGTHTETLAGTFAVTATTFTFTPTGQAAMTWTMRAGDLVRGVAQTLYMVRVEDAECLNAVTATKQ